MPLAKSFGSADAVSGVATVDLSDYDTRGGVQLTIKPVSASGTGSLFFKPAGDNAVSFDFEPLLDSAGAQKTVDLSAQSTLFVNADVLFMGIDGLRVTSSVSGDTFTVHGG